MWIWGSGSTIPKCGSQDQDPDPRHNEMDPQRCLLEMGLWTFCRSDAGTVTTRRRKINALFDKFNLLLWYKVNHLLCSLLYHSLHSYINALSCRWQCYETKLIHFLGAKLSLQINFVRLSVLWTVSCWTPNLIISTYICNMSKLVFMQRFNRLFLVQGVSHRKYSVYSSNASSKGKNRVYSDHPVIA